MKVLLDNNVPQVLRPFLSPHQAFTARDMGRATLTNGRLLLAAEEAGFDLLLTADKNMQHQQNLSKRSMSIRVLSVQQWPELRPHVALVVAAINAAGPGTVALVHIPTP